MINDRVINASTGERCEFTDLLLVFRRCDAQCFTADCLKVFVVFGFNVNKSILTAFLSSTLGAGGATLLGKTIVTNLIKLIPGAGTIIGGAISAGTAGVLTAALGEAYIGIIELVFKGEMSIDDLSTQVGKDKMITF